MRNDISHSVNSMPRNIFIGIKWLAFLFQQFAYMLTNDLESHNAGIECHHTIGRNHEVFQFCHPNAPFLNQVYRLKNILQPVSYG